MCDFVLVVNVFDIVVSFKLENVDNVIMFVHVCYVLLLLLLCYFAAETGAAMHIIHWN